MMTLTPRE